MELQVTALPAAHSWGRSAFLTVASTVATRFQQVPIFDKKEKNLKGLLIFIGCHSWLIIMYVVPSKSPGHQILSLMFIILLPCTSDLSVMISCLGLFFFSFLF